MALFTGKGDKGDTSLFGCKQRVSKSSAAIEALGALDEINSLIGWCKTRAGSETATILESVQQNLFIIQAEVAGAEKKIEAEKVTALGKIINDIEGQLPPITSFRVAGGTGLAALLDYARAVARRAERRVIKVAEERKVSEPTLAYLNRLSSLLYALARLENHKSGIKESVPRY